ncbi:class I SAM-dependent methyltransferase [Psychrobacillus sp. NEAU-3TGS]|uniref:class I SAM-dependent methyltransferase n=1 Tax=Psychrobacillus sp. NEAU-3TGS TaxID=2995412 RepID=UPI002495B827|nr:class I SAM-dependent methyltransferase [Psychrobacillus sp. NEAU-3TGS]MDI2587940.1 class I SAM-dependent methyltransferase [Psychrobacillus sp. NEAU-3TGS]
MSNIINYYNQFDEWGRLDREPIEFQVNWHYIKKYLPTIGRVLDNGAGPGKYSMKLAAEGYKVTLTDLTPKLVDFAKSKAIELGLEKQFDGLYAADARKLNMLKNEQFDASLMLGPMYHLQDEQDRLKAVEELYRVTKKNGLVFVAYMPRVRHILTSLLAPENWKPNNNIDTIVQFSQTGCFNHADEGRFTGAYYFNIEDINPFMESQGFESIQLIGSNIGTILNNESWNYWRDKGEQELQKVIDLIIEKGADPYILGISSHLLYIGRKR